EAALASRPSLPPHLEGARGSGRQGGPVDGGRSAFLQPAAAGGARGRAAARVREAARAAAADATRGVRRWHQCGPARRAARAGGRRGPRRASLPRAPRRSGHRAVGHHRRRGSRGAGDKGCPGGGDRRRVAHAGVPRLVGVPAGDRQVPPRAGEPAAFTNDSLDRARWLGSTALPYTSRSSIRRLSAPLTRGELAPPSTPQEIAVTSIDGSAMALAAARGYAAGSMAPIVATVIIAAGLALFLWTMSYRIRPLLFARKEVRWDDPLTRTEKLIEYGFG